MAATMTSCGDGSAEDNSPANPPAVIETVPMRTVLADNFTTKAAPEDVPEATASDNAPTSLWTNDELNAMAMTLAGECYDDKVQDKRKVCEVILNRVSNEGFPDTVLGVLSYPNAFCGYWSQSRKATENDYEVARQALQDWYDNGCQPLSNYLFFEAGENRENVFREEY